ncbi:hypothetical protein DVH24_006384, partial [Malus domestica]
LLIYSNCTSLNNQVICSSSKPIVTHCHSLNFTKCVKQKELLVDPNPPYSFATEQQKQKVNGKHQLPLAKVELGKEVYQQCFSPSTDPGAAFPSSSPLLCSLTGSSFSASSSSSFVSATKLYWVQNCFNCKAV